MAYGQYRCYLTNNSRYDLKLVDWKAYQFGVHPDWWATWDISPPSSIKSGQQATFGTSVSGIDGNSTKVQYAVMHGAETLGLVYISGTVAFVGGATASANTDIPRIVYTWSEGGREPLTHRVAIGNWDYDDPDWHWP